MQEREETKRQRKAYSLRLTRRSAHTKHFLNSHTTVQSSPAIPFFNRFCLSFVECVRLKLDKKKLRVRRTSVRQMDDKANDFFMQMHIAYSAQSRTPAQRGGSCFALWKRGSRFNFANFSVLMFDALLHALSDGQTKQQTIKHKAYTIAHESLSYEGICC